MIYEALNGSASATDVPMGLLRHAIRQYRSGGKDKVRKKRN